MVDLQLVQVANLIEISQLNVVITYLLIEVIACGILRYEVRFLVTCNGNFAGLVRVGIRLPRIGTVEEYFIRVYHMIVVAIIIRICFVCRRMLPSI